MKFSLKIIFHLSILELTLANTACPPNWDAYLDLKCFKVLNTPHNFADATTACHSLDSDSTLTTIHSAEEQTFLVNYLFKTKAILDPVWLGGQLTGKTFQWTAESKSAFTEFTNWAPGCPVNRPDRACLQMASEGNQTGKWTDEPCNKVGNVVLCQKTQIWSNLKLQTALLEMRKDMKRNAENPVPIGFLYVQLSNQPQPSTLWPQVKWTEVTADYSGLFFRAAGGQAATFGAVQSENYPRITNARNYRVKWANVPTAYSDVAIEYKGTESNYMETGDAGSGDSAYFLKFVSQGGEVRPKNMAMKIWKRSG